jgi:hypothetical protein
MTSLFICKINEAVPFSRNVLGNATSMRQRDDDDSILASPLARPAGENREKGRQLVLPYRLPKRATSLRFSRLDMCAKDPIFCPPMTLISDFKSLIIMENTPGDSRE